MRRPVRWGVTLALLLMMAGVAVWGLMAMLGRPVGQVAIHGDVRYADVEQLRERMLPLVAVPFWSVDLPELRDALEGVAWIKTADIRRHWPDQLEINLTERQPIAYWNDDQLIDAEAVLLPDSPKFKDTLPHLRGPQARRQEVLDMAAQLRQKLTPKQLKLTALTLEPRGAWALQLDDAIWVDMGRARIQPRFQRFIAAWEDWLGQYAHRIERVDMRYPHGLSVRWRKTQAPNVAN